VRSLLPTISSFQNSRQTGEFARRIGGQELQKCGLAVQSRKILRPTNVDRDRIQKDLERRDFRADKSLRMFRFYLQGFPYKSCKLLRALSLRSLLVLAHFEVMTAPV
jgi:hypothetical protein